MNAPEPGDVTRATGPQRGPDSGVAAGHEGGESTTLLSLPMEDLSSDALLGGAPRATFLGKRIPALGAIPLLAKLGQGGMGAVYYGIHPRLKQEVAVKVLPFPLLANQPELVQRFFLEAQIAARVRSPHLVGVLDVNEDSGLFYLVMEFVHGQSAGGHLRQRKKQGSAGLDEAVALDLCIAATEGLAAAHTEGIIHRDIKPDNILLPRLRNTDRLDYKAAKLADLGLARSEELSQSLTGSHAAVGTPSYMAPEQALDARKARKPADVYSMGATLYALLCGRGPFTGGTATEVILAVIQQPHVPIKEVRPGTTVATGLLIDTCLAKQPGDRYVDASALLEALKTCRKAIGDPAGTRMHVRRLSQLKAAAESGRPVPPPDAPLPRPAPQIQNTVLRPAASGGAVAKAGPPAASGATLGVFGERALAGAAVVALGVAAWVLFPMARRPDNAPAPAAPDNLAPAGDPKPVPAAKGAESTVAEDRDAETSRRDAALEEVRAQALAAEKACKFAKAAEHYLRAASLSEGAVRTVLAEKAQECRRQDCLARGMAGEELRDYAEAEKWYRKALDIKPDPLVSEKLDLLRQRTDHAPATPSTPKAQDK